MSAIAGVYSRHGAPVSRDVLTRLSRRLDQLGPDGEEFAYSAEVAMAHRPFTTERETRTLRQPVVTPDGYMLAFDGRLDNAAELRRAFAGTRQAERRGAEVVIAVYRRWGVTGFGCLVGDFAFSLWDPREHRLLLCADTINRRPLYYRVTPHQVVWSSMSRPLLETLDIPLELDEEYVADFLTNRASVAAPFKGILHVPGGHVLVVDAGRAELTRYWSFDPGREIRYRTDAEYERHFADLFREVVACRLQTEGPVFSELSGGVDSASIACMADRLVRERSVAAPELRTVTYAYRGSSASDETSYAGAIEDHLGRPGLRLTEENCPLLQPLPESFVPELPTDGIWFYGHRDRVARAMDAAGSRVLLSGCGGDQMFMSQTPVGLALADVLADGRVVELFRRTGDWARLLKVPYGKALFGACRPFLPRSVQARVQDEVPLGEWFAPAFAKRMRLRERLLPMSDDLGFHYPTASWQYGLVREAMRIFALEPCLSDGYVDIRYPYLDRRLIEFALAIPVDQKARLGESRSIVRRALKGLVPEAVLQRRSKSGPGEAIYRALIREWPRLARILDDPLVAAHGFVDRDAFRAAANRARHGVVSQQVHLTKTISLELWLRQLEKRPRVGDPAPSGWRQTVDEEGAFHVERA